MTKNISCSDAGKDCKWSASTEEELMEKVTQHVVEEHKEIELNSESIARSNHLSKISKF